MPPHLQEESEEDVVGGIAARAPPPPIAEVRDLDAPELAALDALLEIFAAGIRAQWEDEFVLKVVARRDLDPQRRIVLVPPGVLGVVAPFEPQLVGLPVASLSRRGARLSLEGGRLVARAAKHRVVRLRPKGETMFLYGRHVLTKSVSGVVGPVAAGDEVIVVREGDAAYLGIGIAQPPLLQLTRGSRRGPRERRAMVDQEAVALTNRLDLGRYLRVPQEAPE